MSVATPKRLSRAKRIGFRLAAMVLGVLPFVLLEVGLRWANVGRVTEADDAFLGFQSVRPLFELNAAGDRYETAPSRRVHFYPDSFAARKGENEYRIFCLGGSTVQGNPYSIETAFSTWFELSLDAADPSHDWEVVNCGGISYASYRLVPIFKEVLAHQADAVVLCTGHNEFLEARTYRPGTEPTYFARLQQRLLQLRSLNLVRSLLRSGQTTSLERAAAAPEVLQTEVDALLDYRGGLADYHRDDDWRAGTVAHYEYNLRRMTAMAEAAGVKVILIDPVANLADCPPFKVEPGPGLTPQQREQFDRLWTAARNSDDSTKRIQLLEQAVAIDPRHAEAHFLLGQAYLAQHRTEEAYAAFVRAKDEDICPLRMIEPLHAALRRVATDTHTPLLEARRVIESQSPVGIAGDGQMLDHVHPSITGHQLIADLLTQHMFETGLAQPRSDWRTLQHERYREHLGTLDAVYYAKGKQRLEGLRRWTQGRAKKLRGAAPGTPRLIDDGEIPAQQ